MTSLSIPFRILPSGACATVEDGSTAAHAEAIAALARTVAGEYPMLPSYGVDDPAWVGIDAAQLQAGLEAFGPEGVVISAVTTTAGETVDRVVIEFTDVDPIPTPGAIDG